MRTSRTASAVLFWVPVIVLIALVPVLPWAASTYLGLDERTPLAIAQDQLHTEYGLEPVDTGGHGMSQGEASASTSEFSVEDGATTEDVPFLLDGELVHCTVHMPTGDPRSVTATCAE